MTGGLVAWLTGPPAAGKSTIAREVALRLRRRGLSPVLLDGDEVRACLHPPAGYDDEGRARFYATLGDLASLLAAQGALVVVAATAHRREYRERARRAAPRFLEVYVRCDPDRCAARDPKGLYARARAGELAQLPGASALYEEPPEADLTVDGGGDAGATADAVAAAILRARSAAPGPAG